MSTLNSTTGVLSNSIYSCGCTFYSKCFLHMSQNTQTIVYSGISNDFSDLKIKKLCKGFLVTIGSEQMAFESVSSMVKFIEKKLGEKNV
jgi:hypothetical protein